MKRLLLAVVAVCLLSVSSFACTNIYGWANAVGGSPNGTTRVAGMRVNLDVLHPEFGWIGYKLAFTDAGGFYYFQPGGNGIYRVRATPLEPPYEGTVSYVRVYGPPPPSGFKKSVVQFANCPNETSVQIDINYDYTNY